jgi:hypothetical protein
VIKLERDYRVIRVLFQANARNIFSFSKRLHVLWGPPTLPSSRYVGVKLVTYLHLVPTLKMSGAIPPLPPYAFMVGTGIPIRVACMNTVRSEVKTAVTITIILF